MGIDCVLTARYICKNFTMKPTRFQDQHKRLSDFQTEVWVSCPRCKQRAVAKVDYELCEARLLCLGCGYHKKQSAEMTVMGHKGNWTMAAHYYFDAELWLQYPFKNDVFFAYNPAHLEYLGQYIAAGLREHKDRAHFTLLEKLPRFYHQAKNREALLRIISLLKQK